MSQDDNLKLEIVLSFNSHLLRQSSAVIEQRKVYQHDKVLRDHHQRNDEP